MSPQEADEVTDVTSLADLDLVVDADSHTTENLEDILPHMENDWARDTIERSMSPMSDVYSWNLASPPYPDLISGGDDSDEIGLESCRSASEKLGRLDEYGINKALVSPTTTSGITSINNDRLAVALAQAYNSWLFNSFFEDTDRLKGHILAVPQRPEMAAEEIDKYADEDRVGGIAFPDAGLLPPAGHDMYDPIYEAAEDHDLPVFMHSVGANFNVSFPTQYQWTETFAEGHALSHPYFHMWSLTTLLFRGIPERFDVDFVIQEAGIAWVPYMKWRLDDHYLELSHEIPHLEHLPSEYIDEQFYFTTQPLGHTAENPEHMAKAVEIAGPRNVLYAADLPHPDFDLPEEFFNRISSHFDGDEVRSMMGETASELVGL